MKEGGKMNHNEETKLMAGVLRQVEKTTGVTLRDECIDYFFQKWRDDVRYITEESGNENPIRYAEFKTQERQELDFIDDLSKRFGKWNREHNPVTIMVDDLRNRGCSKATIYSYRSVGNAFMRLFSYEPEFTLAEYNQFMNQYQDSAPGTRRCYRDT
jgi:hypothetical protein